MRGFYFYPVYFLLVGFVIPMKKSPTIPKEKQEIKCGLSHFDILNLNPFGVKTEVIRNVKIPDKK